MLRGGSVDLWHGRAKFLGCHPCFAIHYCWDGTSYWWSDFIFWGGVICTAPRDGWGMCECSGISFSELHLYVPGPFCISSWWIRENCVGGWWIRDHINNCKVLLGCYDERHVRGIKVFFCTNDLFIKCLMGMAGLGVLCALFRGRQRWEPCYPHQMMTEAALAIWQWAGRYAASVLQRKSCTCSLPGAYPLTRILTKYGCLFKTLKM